MEIPTESHASWSSLLYAKWLRWGRLMTMIWSPISSQILFFFPDMHLTIHKIEQTCDSALRKQLPHKFTVEYQSYAYINRLVWRCVHLDAHKTFIMFALKRQVEASNSVLLNISPFLFHITSNILYTWLITSMLLNNFETKQVLWTMKTYESYELTLVISSGVRAPCISCLFAKTNKDAPDNLWKKNI